MANRYVVKARNHDRKTCCDVWFSVKRLTNDSIHYLKNVKSMLSENFVLKTDRKSLVINLLNFTLNK